MSEQFDLAAAREELVAVLAGGYNPPLLAEWALCHGDAALAEIARLRAEREWVSVEDERKPPNKELILIATWWGGVFAGLWDSGAGTWYIGHTCKMTPLAHWMPLPAAPEVTP